MNKFESTIRDEARRAAVIAYNRAWSWNDHPSYDDKAAILLQIGKAEALLEAIAIADGRTAVIEGINIHALDRVRQQVAGRKRGTQMDLPRLGEFLQFKKETA